MLNGTLTGSRVGLPIEAFEGNDALFASTVLTESPTVVEFTDDANVLACGDGEFVGETWDECAANLSVCACRGCHWWWALRESDGWRGCGGLESGWEGSQDGGGTNYGRRGIVVSSLRGRELLVCHEGRGLKAGLMLMCVCENVPLGKLLLLMLLHHGLFLWGRGRYSSRESRRRSSALEKICLSFRV